MIINIFKLCCGSPMIIFIFVSFSIYIISSHIKMKITIILLWYFFRNRDEYFRMYKDKIRDGIVYGDSDDRRTHLIITYINIYINSNVYNTQLRSVFIVHAN